VRRALFLCDIKDSTPELFRSGDAGYIEMIRDMSRTVRARLRQYDGVEFKHTGDGIFAWFASAVSAARSALAIQADLANRNEVMGGSPLILRIGLAAGEPVPEEGDFFGVSLSWPAA
jgi:class 3 adenylate cyclase